MWEGRCRLQRPHGLRRRVAGARWLELPVRIPPGPWMSVTSERCVLSGRGLCGGPIPRPEKSCRMWVSLSVIRCNNNPLHLQWVGRRDKTKKEQESRAGLRAWRLLQRVRPAQKVFRCQFRCSCFEDTTCDYIAVFSQTFLFEEVIH